MTKTSFFTITSSTILIVSVFQFHPAEAANDARLYSEHSGLFRRTTIKISPPTELEGKPFKTATVNQHFKLWPFEVVRSAGYTKFVAAQKYGITIVVDPSQDKRPSTRVMLFGRVLYKSAHRPTTEVPLQ